VKCIQRLGCKRNERKREFGTPWRWGEDNIKMDIKEIM
jgi:hypothetical protein